MPRTLPSSPDRPFPLVLVSQAGLPPLAHPSPDRVPAGRRLGGASASVAVAERRRRAPAGPAVPRAARPPRQLQARLAALGAGRARRRRPGRAGRRARQRRADGLRGASDDRFARYLAPLVEEALKALWIAVLLRRGRVGFLVDAAILGFAVGAGFALVENVEYLRAHGRAARAPVARARLRAPPSSTGPRRRSSR